VVRTPNGAPISRIDLEELMQAFANRTATVYIGAF
jgi:hypothetical protein